MADNYYIMDTHSIIKQFTEQLSNSPLEEERITELKPIDFIFNYQHSEDESDSKDHQWSFLCVPTLERNKQSKRIEFNDIKYVEVSDKELFEVLCQYDYEERDQFIEYFNRKIFEYIQSKVQNSMKMGAWDNENMWYEPNKRFTQWFDLKAFDLSKSVPLEKKPKIPKSEPQKKPKGGRPKDPNLQDKKDKLNKEYYQLTKKKGLKSSVAVKMLSEVYGWTYSTIETYLK